MWNSWTRWTDDCHLPVERRAPTADGLAAETALLIIIINSVTVIDDDALRKLPPSLPYADPFLGQSDQKRAANAPQTARIPRRSKRTSAKAHSGLHPHRSHSRSPRYRRSQSLPSPSLSDVSAAAAGAQLEPVDVIEQLWWRQRQRPVATGTLRQSLWRRSVALCLVQRTLPHPVTALPQCLSQFPGRGGGWRARRAASRRCFCIAFFVRFRTGRRRCHPLEVLCWSERWWWWRWWRWWWNVLFDAVRSLVAQGQGFRLCRAYVKVSFTSACRQELCLCPPVLHLLRISKKWCPYSILILRFAVFKANFFSFWGQKMHKFSVFLSKIVKILLFLVKILVLIEILVSIVKLFQF